MKRRAIDEGICKRAEIARLNALNENAPYFSFAPSYLM